uniref:Receptor expression-enhancing protein n=1 Tax=Ascaris lumbricoides TaxID=6252 RepID=A0A0M3I0F6_ASCLU
MSSKHPDDPDLAAISPDLAEPKSFISETEMAEILDPFKEWHPYFMEALYHPKWKWIDTAFTWIQVKCYIRREQALGKKRRPGVPGEREHWLTYWTVFAFFTLQDYYSGWLTANFPPFYLLKMLFLVLLALPTSGVSEKCFYLVVSPILSKLDDTFTRYNVERLEPLSSTQASATSSSEFSQEGDDEISDPDVSA